MMKLGTPLIINRANTSDGPLLALSRMVESSYGMVRVMAVRSFE